MHGQGPYLSNLKLGSTPINFIKHEHFGVNVLRYISITIVCTTYFPIISRIIY